MKAILGVDDGGGYRLAMDLFARLNFSDPTVELVHVDELTPYLGAGNEPFHYDTLLLAIEARKERTEKLLETAQSEAASVNITSKTLGGVGSACDTLIRRADETHADLVAVGSTHKSKMEAVVLGSVGRGLTLAARHSVLVAKNPPKSSGPVTAVFATDCSDFVDECLSMLVRMKPHGIGRLIVVSAVEEFGAGKSLPEVTHHVANLVNHLKSEGFNAEGEVVEGKTTSVIDDVMTSTNSDLLILGSERHGFFDRLGNGSVALEEVVSTPYSLLLLRTH